MPISVVRARAGVLAPAAVIGHAAFLAAIGPLGIAPPTPVYAFDFVMLAVAVAIAVAIRRQRISERYMFHAAAAMVLCATTSVVASMYATNRQVYGLLFVLQIANVAMVLHTRVAIAAIATIVGVGIPLCIRAGGPDTPIYVAVLVAAGYAAGLTHVTMRRALVSVERHRAEADAAARQLAVQIDELTRLQEQLLHAQRMDAVGTLAAGIAHDMNNVLASIRNLGQLLIADDRDPSTRADLEQILAQTARGAALTGGLLAFSRRGQYRKATVPIGDVVREVIPMLERTLPKSIELRNELEVADACVEGDVTQLEQVLINLALNAQDAMNGTGTLTIATDTSDGRVRIRVTDTGCGMDEATRLRVFEPFFTTKMIGRGTGLGLSIVWGIVQSHGGSVSVDSQPGAGATFTIVLPLTERRPTPVAPPRPAEPAVVGGTVLLVDDDAMVRASTARLLQRTGFDILTAENGADALERFAAHEADIRLVILDMGMPVMGGAECFRRLRERSEVPVLIATGYSDDAEAQSLVSAGAVIIEKPFSSAQLRSEVNRLITGARMTSTA